MNGAQRETSGSGLGSDVENLDVVLGRFKDWAETRRAKPFAASGSGIAALPIIAKSPLEARELSYEEALRASRHRRPADLAAIDPRLPEIDAGQAANANPEENRPGPPEPVWRETSSSGPHFTRQAQWTESRFVRAARALTPEPPAVRPALNAVEAPHRAAQILVEDRPPLPEALSPARVGVVEPSGAGLSPALEASAETLAPASHADSSVAVVPGRPRPATTRPKGGTTRKQPLIQPAFRDVLKGTAALVAASQPCGPALQRGKAASLTLRVTDGEQARIQACAARANLSVSAYLRQCALGVDDLREQVELALSSLHQQQAQPAPPLGISAIPGILGRFAIQCLRRLRQNPEDYTVVSLR